MADKTFYDFQATTLQGEDVSMDAYRDQVVLVVNTASECGFTPQFEGLEELYTTYKDKGFTVLGFPCNQFGGQEPLDGDGIQEFCQVNYGVSFPMFEKIDVNGSGAHPLFDYLKDEQGSILGKKIKWNFTKFLIDRSGTPVDRFAPTTTPKKISGAIEKLL